MKIIVLLLALIGSTAFANNTLPTWFYVPPGETACFFEMGIYCEEGEVNQCFLPGMADTFHQCVSPVTSTFGDGQKEISCGCDEEKIVVNNLKIFQPLAGEYHSDKQAVTLDAQVGGIEFKGLKGVRETANKGVTYSLLSESGEKLVIGDTVYGLQMDWYSADGNLVLELDKNNCQ